MRAKAGDSHLRKSVLSRGLGWGSMIGALLSVWLLPWQALHGQEQRAAGAGYEIHPGDLLYVSVWKEPELQQEVLVRPDGSFSFPLTGEIDARGKTVDQVRQEIEQRLARYIPDLVVTVSVKQTNNKVYVIGQVNKPGEYLVNPMVDVTQAISMAGGTTPFADLREIRILRRNEAGQQQAFRFRYDEVVRGRELQQNIMLQSGDVVVVP